MSQVKCSEVWCNDLGLPRCRQVAWFPATCDTAQIANYSFNGSPLSRDLLQLWTPLGRIFSVSNQHCPTAAPVLVRPQPWGPSILSQMGSLPTEPSSVQDTRRSTSALLR
ncbi:hypothetical protein D918_07989 [Trichuris suis]|nr:hypothetical protein D918_07989 [Trichuris suis]